MTIASELFSSLDSVIKEVHTDHVSTQKLWMPSELLPEDYQPREIPPEITAALVQNLITEDGLPYFTSLIASHLGTEGAAWDWNRTWTAEEDRHGNAIKLYLHKALTRSQCVAIEHIQYSYLNDGFLPDWDQNPIRLLAYVVIQEKATLHSHHGIAKRAKDFDPHLAKMMRQIGAEENKHHNVYFRIFERAMSLDPSVCLEALYSVVRTFEMPGKKMAESDMFNRLQTEMQTFGAVQFADIVDDVCKRLSIGNASDLSEAGERAQDRIPRFIRRMRENAERRKPLGEAFHFSFLPEPFRL